jgi:quercetin dioxygenase-like cupin family protein
MKPTPLSFAVLLALPLLLHAGQSSTQDPVSDAASAAAAEQPATADAPSAQAGSNHVLVNAADLKWGDAPPAFERGAQAVVLSGDPGKAGWFVLRLKAPAGYKIANHWHPTDEQVTLLEGDVSLRMNDGTQTKALTPGAYVLLPAHMHHAVTTSGGMTVQVSAMGPFELTYVDPKDDPRTRSP